MSPRSEESILATLRSLERRGEMPELCADIRGLLAQNKTAVGPLSYTAMRSAKDQAQAERDAFLKRAQAAEEQSALRWKVQNDLFADLEAEKAKVTALKGSLVSVREFVEAEVDNRLFGGATGDNYYREAGEALAQIDAALAALEGDKACPFCGSRALRRLSDGPVEQTQCRTCKAMGPPTVVGQKDGPDWNSRVVVSEAPL